MKIFLDLDEVLVDFVGGALAVHGWTREQLHEAWTPGVWDMTVPMGLTEEEFWRPIHAAGETFWTGLQPLPWAEEVLALVRRYADDWTIATAPSLCPTSRLGKERWLRSYFGPAFDRYVITTEKHRLAGPGRILIDDREETCRKWSLAGGIGQVFPAHQNSLHQHKHDPVPVIRLALEGLCREYRPESSRH